MSRDNRIIAFSMLLWGLGESMWYFIRGLYLERLGATPPEVGLALGLAALTHALAYLPGGLLADRFDRKTLMLAGWSLGLIAPPLMALADDWRPFLIGFTVYNLSAFVVPVIDTYVVNAADGAPLERVLPTVFAGFWIGSVIGPQVSQVLLPTIGGRGVLFLSSFVFGVSTLALTFVRRQPAARSTRRAGPRVSPIRALRPAWWFFGFLFVIYISMSVGAQLIPNYLGRIGWQMADVSGIVSAQPIGIATLTVIIGHYAAGRNRRGLIVAQALVLAAIAVFAFGARAWGGFVAAGYLLLGGFDAARQQAVARMPGYVEPEHLGLAFGTASTVGEIAVAAASVTGGVLFALDPAMPFYAGLILIPIGLLLTRRLRGPKRVDASAGAAHAAPVMQDNVIT